MFPEDFVPPTFEREELSTLLRAPLFAVVAVLLVEEADPVQFLQRLHRAAQVLAQAQQQQPKFGSLAASLATLSSSQLDAAQLQPDEIVAAREYELLELLQRFGTAAEGRGRAIALCAQISEILALKVSYPQAQAYCNWVLSVARSVADTLLQENNTAEEQAQLYHETVVAELQSALAIPQSDQ